MGLPHLGRRRDRHVNRHIDLLARGLVQDGVVVAAEGVQLEEALSEDSSAVAYFSKEF